MGTFTIATIILVVASILLFFHKKFSDVGYVFIGIAFALQGISLLKMDTAFTPAALLIVSGFFIGTAIARIRSKKNV